MHMFLTFQKLKLNCISRRKPVCYWWIWNHFMEWKASSRNESIDQSKSSTCAFIPCNQFWWHPIVGIFIILAYILNFSLFCWKMRKLQSFKNLSNQFAARAYTCIYKIKYILSYENTLYLRTYEISDLYVKYQLS